MPFPTPLPTRRKLTTLLTGRHFVAAITSIFFCVYLFPTVWSEPSFVDENFYSWSGHYYFSRLIRLDFQAVGSDHKTDPGWDPNNAWSYEAPVGFRLVYGALMQVLSLAPPAEPFDWDNRLQPETLGFVPRETLVPLRLAALMASAVGLGALAYRFGRPGSYAAVLVFVAAVQPHDLTRVMAEPPLLLALGACVLSFGTPLFAVAAALAASCKLTALALWPLMTWPKAVGVKGWRLLVMPFITAGLWTLLNPPSWFAGGPFYLLTMMRERQIGYVEGSVTFASSKLYWPSWYGVPWAYLLAIVIASALPRLALRLFVFRQKYNFDLSHRHEPD